MEASDAQVRTDSSAAERVLRGERGRSRTWSRTQVAISTCTVLFLRSTHGGQLQPWSVHEGPAKVLHCGVVREEQWGPLTAAFHQLRNEKEAAVKKERRKGLSKTPDTIQWLAEAVVAKVCDKLTPQ